MIRTAWIAGLVCLVDPILLFAADIEFAHGLFKQNRFELAVPEYEAYLKTAPAGRVIETKFFLAESYLQLGKNEQSLPLYEQILKSSPTTDRYHRHALFRSGQLLLQRREFQRAKAAVESFVMLFPDDPLVASALYVSGEADLGLGDDPGAQKAFENALRKNPDESVKANIDFGLAKLIEKQGDTDQALQRYQAIAKNPALAVADDALLAVGAIEFQRGDFAAALRSFDSLASQFPASDLLPSVTLNRGLCLYQLGRFNEAIASLQSVTDRAGDPAYRPLVGDAWLYQARAIAAKGKPDQAAQSLRTAAATTTDIELQAILLAEAAKFELDSGDAVAASKALLALTRSHAQSPQIDRVWYYLCLASAKTNQLQELKTAFQTLQEKHATSLYRDRATVVVVRTLLDQNPPLINREQLAGLLKPTKEENARQWLSYYAGLLEFRDEQFQQALDAVSPLLASKLSDNVLANDCRYLAGVSLTRLNRPNEAVAYLTDYLRGSTDSVLAASAATQLGHALAGLPNDQAASLVKKVTDSLAKQADGCAALQAFADGLYESDQTTHAVTVYRQALLSRPTPEQTIKLNLGLAWCLVAEKKHHDALAALETLKIDGAQTELNAERWYLVGLCRQQQLNTGESLAAFEMVYSKNTGNYRVDAALRSARLLSADGNHERADELLRKIAADAVGDARFREQIEYERAWLANDSGRHRDAYDRFRAFIEQFPDSASSAETLLKLSELAYAFGEFDQSLNWVKQLETQDPAGDILPMMLYRKGAAALKLRDFTLAEESFGSLKSQASSDADLMALADFWQAELAFAQHQNERAGKQFEQLLLQPQAKKHHGLACLRLAELQLEERNWDKAHAQADKVQNHTEEVDILREALFVKAKSLQQRARFDEARQEYTKALSDNRDELSAKSQFMIAETHLHQKQYRDALKEYLKVDILYPHPQWRSMALLQVAKCHQSLDEKNKAAQATARLLEEFPDTPAAQQAQKQIGRPR